MSMHQNDIIDHILEPHSTVEHHLRYYIALVLAKHLKTKIFLCVNSHYQNRCWPEMLHTLWPIAISRLCDECLKIGFLESWKKDHSMNIAAIVNIVKPEFHWAAFLNNTEFARSIQRMIVVMPGLQCRMESFCTHK